MTYQRIQLYLNTRLLAEFDTTPDRSKSILYQFDYTPDFWTGELENEIINNSAFCFDSGLLEIYKVFCITPVSEIRFIAQNGRIKSITFDTPTTNNSKLFTLSISDKDEFSELTYHLLNEESHLEQNYQNPFMYDRSYIEKETAQSMIGEMGNISTSMIISRDFKIFTLGDRYG